MDRRTVAGTFCATLFASAGASMIGATALPPHSAFFTALMVAGIIGLIASLIGFAWLFATRPQDLDTGLNFTFSGAPPAEPLDDREKALRALKIARDKAVLARKRRDEDECREAINELSAALTGVNRVFGVHTAIEGRGGSYRALLLPFLEFTDRIYPLLRDGHINAASQKAKEFTWP